MFASPVARRHGTERAWTEHLATTVGALALLEVVRSAPLPPPVVDTLDEVLDALRAETVVDGAGVPQARPTHQLTHQLHLGGRFPDVAVDDVRDRLFAVIEAQRHRADDRHIAKLAAHYVPRSGARLGVLAAEGWHPSSARHPAWTACPAPVVVVVALEAFQELDYRAVWVHHPADSD